MNCKKLINLIVAVDSKFGIAKAGNIPWHIKEDLQYFFGKTTSTIDAKKMNAVIMGKNSWKTIPKKYRGLIKRFNIVVSSTMTEDELHSDNTTGTPVKLARSVDDALKMCYTDENIEDIYICGGSLIYRDIIRRNIIDNCYITKIFHDYNCDTFFPINDWTKFIQDPNRVVSLDESTLLHSENKDGVSFTFNKYNVSYNNVGEYQYLNLIKKIIDEDKIGRETRNATTVSIFGPQIEFNLNDGFPLLTTKHMFWRGIAEELFFFIKGDTNTNRLMEKNVRIWEPNTTREFLDSRNLDSYAVGDMGPMYGWNWRHFSGCYEGMDKDYTGIGYDQFKDVLYQLKFNPTSRRIMMTTYDPSKVSQSVLAPCHGLMIQFYVDIENKALDCKMYQRSVDTMLGLPFNITSYALLMSILAHVCGYTPRRLIMTLGDTHIYKEHIESALEQISRKPYNFPTLEICKPFDHTHENHENHEDWISSALSYIEGLQFSDFKIVNYVSHPTIKMPMIA